MSGEESREQAEDIINNEELVKEAAIEPIIIEEEKPKPKPKASRVRAKPKSTLRKNQLKLWLKNLRLKNSQRKYMN